MPIFLCFKLWYINPNPFKIAIFPDKLKPRKVLHRTMVEFEFPLVMDSVVHFLALYNNSKTGLDSVFLKAMDTFGEISFIVNSIINDSMEGKKEVKPKDGYTFRISKMGLLAAKYMGRHNSILIHLFPNFNSAS